MPRKKPPAPPVEGEERTSQPPAGDVSEDESSVEVPPIVDESLVASVSLEGAEDEEGSALLDEAAQTTASGEVVHSLDQPAEDDLVDAFVASFTPGDVTLTEASEQPGVEAPVEPVTEGATEEEPAGDHPGPARAAPRSVSELHLRGIIESLVFVSDRPIPVGDIAKVARADVRDVRRLLEELREDYRSRGIHLDELAGGWQFRSSAANAPFVRELLQAKPIRLTRAQVETLAIMAYRQPITRPEIDEIRGVDSGATIKVLLDRDLVRILGRKEDVGRPVLYGTSTHFLEFFGLKSLRDLPTLREFTELTPESEATLVRELGDEAAPESAEAAAPVAAESGGPPADSTEEEEGALASAEGAEVADGERPAESAPIEDDAEPQGERAEVDDGDSPGALSEGIDDPGEAPRGEDAARDEGEPHRDIDPSS